MKIKFVLLICIALAMASCAQLEKSMKGRNDMALKRDLEFSRWSAFTKRAGGGEKAVGEFHRIYLLVLADREAAFKAFSGDKEKRSCQRFARNYSTRAQRFMNINWKDEPLVMAFFIQMPQSYEQVNAFRGCGVETNALDFHRIYIPRVESLLRKNPTLRTAKFRDGFLNYLGEVETLVEKVQPRLGGNLLRRITRARQELQKFITQ